MADKLTPEAKEYFAKAGRRGGKKKQSRMSKKARSEMGKSMAAARWKKKEA